jgi:hypothetical protein
MSKYEDANLILKLYDLRREPVMREARSWFFTFNPTNIQDVMETMMGEHSGHMRMVISYWDMAASLVNNGAIDETMFNEANSEHLFVYTKIEPVIEPMRVMFENPDFLKNLEALVKRIPDSEKIITGMRERIARMTAAMAERTAATKAAQA